MRATYTYAELEIPAELYDLVARKLLDADYGHAFQPGNIREAHTRRDGTGLDYEKLGPIDMHGIALTRGPASLCPSGLAACELNRALLPDSLELPRSTAFAIEDRDWTDAGLRRTARCDDAGGDHDHEQRRPDQVAGLGGEVGRDRAPSVGGAEQVEIKRTADERGGIVGRRVFPAHAPASAAPAAQDTLGSIDFGGELRR